MYFTLVGRTHRQKGICQKADKAEPTCQHQQQGKEEEQELHDDETESERQNKRQTILQRETGKSKLSAVINYFKSSQITKKYLCTFLQLALRDALLKKRKQHK